MEKVASFINNLPISVPKNSKLSDLELLHPQLMVLKAINNRLPLC